MFCVCELYVWYVSGICICISVSCTKPVLTEARCCCCWVSHSADLSYSLTQSLSLNLELACQPLRLSNPLVSSYWWQTFPLGKHNTHCYSVPIGIQGQSTDSPTWSILSFTEVTFRSMSEWLPTRAEITQKQLHHQRPTPNDWELTKIGKSVVHGTAFRKFNKLVCVFSRWLRSKQLLGISTGFCFSQAAGLVSSLQLGLSEFLCSSDQLVSKGISRLYSDRGDPSEYEFQGLPKLFELFPSWLKSFPTGWNISISKKQFYSSTLHSTGVTGPWLHLAFNLGFRDLNSGPF